MKRRLRWVCAVFCFLFLCGLSDVFAAESPVETLTLIQIFVDVPQGHRFYSSVMWGVERSITKGKTSTTFGPTDPCKRQEVITFIWRAEGSPEPEIGNPYADVKTDRYDENGELVEKGDYYAKAAIWAYERGLVTDTTVKTEEGEQAYFLGQTICTRADAVEYLYRLSNSPAVDVSDFNFADIDPSNTELVHAVMWAVQNGITDGKGTDENGRPLFCPEEPCTRGHCITFLYRYMVESL